jgi:hypothetical protein
MDQADLAIFELEERPVGRDALDGCLDYRPDLYLSDLDPFPFRAVEKALSHQPPSPSIEHALDERRGQQFAGRAGASGPSGTTMNPISPRLTIPRHSRAIRSR